MFDLQYYFPKVLQAVPTDDFKVYVYFDNGSIKLFDVAPLDKGEFKKIADLAVFKSVLTILNDTVAWDLSGNYDPTSCLELDPWPIYQGSDVPDPLNNGLDTFFPSIDRDLSPVLC